MSNGSEVRPDWGVDPDVDEDFPDDATIARDLEAYRLRNERETAVVRGTNMWPMLALALAMAFLTATIVPDLRQGREWMRLVRAGGGELNHMAANARCQGQPYLIRPGRHGVRTIPVGIGTPVDVVARENGWALIDRYGNPCWVPSWSLSRTEPDMPAIVRCGLDCHVRPPAGWHEAQRQAACSANFRYRIGCFVDRLFGRAGAPD